jgi:hypothetical protein
MEHEKILPVLLKTLITFRPEHLQQRAYTESSLTSSAIASRDKGNSRPSTFAVFTLTTS